MRTDLLLAGGLAALVIGTTVAIGRAARKTPGPGVIVEIPLSALFIRGRASDPRADDAIRSAFGTADVEIVRVLPGDLYEGVLIRLNPANTRDLPIRHDQLHVTFDKAAVR